MADHTKSAEELGGVHVEVCLECSEMADEGNVVILTLWVVAEANRHVPPRETEGVERAAARAVGSRGGNHG